MSLNPSPSRDGGSVTTVDGAEHPFDEYNYWHSLIVEGDAGAFLGLTNRTMQGLRQKGGGPKFIRLSSRTVRYRRVDLKAWVDARIRTSTSDLGPETVDLPHIGHNSNSAADEGSAAHGGTDPP